MRNLLKYMLLSVVLFAHPAAASDTPVMVEKVLDNGLRIVTMENPGSRTVSVNVFISAGSLDESPETAGLAHFYEHMFFRGTPSLNGLAFKKAIEDRGGVTNATTAKDMTHYFITLPAEEAEEGLALLADALMKAELDPEGIEVERDVVLEEYRIGENNPGRIATEALYQLAYSEHPYGQSTIGTKERIKNFNRADFLRWRNRHYGPTRCTVVVVGDIDAQRMAQRARFLFAGFKGNPDQERNLSEPPAPPEAPVYKEGAGPVGGAVVMMGFPAPSAHDTEDVYGMDVLSFLLGQGPHSKLHKVLVDQKEIASTVGVNYLTPRQRGLMIVSAMGEKDNSEKIRQGVLAQVEALKAGEFTDDDLRRAKAHLLQTFLQGNETNSGKADTIGFYSALGVPDFWKTYPERIEKVTAADVTRVAEKYLTGGHWGYTLKPGSRG